MPMLAKICVAIFFMVGRIFFGRRWGDRSNAATSLTKTEELADADLMVLFLRFRRPDEASFQYSRYSNQTGTLNVDPCIPVLPRSPLTGWGYQTTPPSSTALWRRIDAELLGQKWITHHGHFSTGIEP